MAFTKSKTTTLATAPARRTAVVSKSRYEALETRIKSAGRRARDHAAKRENGLIGIGTGLALGLLNKSGKKLPTIAGLNPNLLYGAGLFLLGPELMKGKNGERLGAIGTGFLTVAASEIPTKGIKVSGDSDDDDDE